MCARGAVPHRSGPAESAPPDIHNSAGWNSQLFLSLVGGHQASDGRTQQRETNGRYPHLRAHQKPDAGRKTRWRRVSSRIFNYFGGSSSTRRGGAHGPALASKASFTACPPHPHRRRYAAFVSPAPPDRQDSSSYRASRSHGLKPKYRHHVSSPRPGCLSDRFEVETARPQLKFFLGSTTRLRRQYHRKHIWTTKICQNRCKPIWQQDANPGSPG